MAFTNLIQSKTHKKLPLTLKNTKHTRSFLRSLFIKNLSTALETIHINTYYQQPFLFFLQSYMHAYVFHYKFTYLITLNHILFNIALIFFTKTSYFYLHLVRGTFG